MPVGFGDVEAGWTFVVGGAFDAMHVSSSREMVVSKFHDEDLCAVLQSIQCLSRDVPVDGSESVARPRVPVH